MIQHCERRKCLFSCFLQLFLWISRIYSLVIALLRIKSDLSTQSCSSAYRALCTCCTIIQRPYVDPRNLCDQIKIWYMCLCSFKASLFLNWSKGAMAVLSFQLQNCQKRTPLWRAGIKGPDFWIWLKFLTVSTLFLAVTFSPAAVGHVYPSNPHTASLQYHLQQERARQNSQSWVWLHPPATGFDLKTVTKQI